MMPDSLEATIAELASTLSGLPAGKASDACHVLTPILDTLLAMQDPAAASELARPLWEALRSNKPLRDAMMQLAEERPQIAPPHMAAGRRLQALATAQWMTWFKSGRRLSADDRERAQLVALRGADLMATIGFDGSGD